MKLFLEVGGNESHNYCTELFTVRNDALQAPQKSEESILI